MTGNNQRGFALILIVALLPIFTAGLMMIFAMMGIMQTDLALKYACRIGGIEGQQKVKPLLTSLLALNPLAKSLQLQKIKAQQEIISSPNAATKLTATAKLLRIKQQQRTLAIRQKQIITQSNLLLTKKHLTTLQQIRYEARQSSARLFFLESKQDITITAPPKLAVRPDSAETAPTYSPVTNFESEQALAHHWQYTVALRSPLNILLPGAFTFTKACAITLQKENSKWKVKITKGRYSLKSVW